VVPFQKCVFLAWRTSCLEVGIIGHKFWRAIQGPFHQSLVSISPVVCRHSRT
jgi:hypothetical protein